jgi:multidrug efflux pump subunit AcrA (membrane-fusion protein)
VGVAQANIEAQQSLIKVLTQQKAYQRVVAPLDGVITQRAVDVGSPFMIMRCRYSSA